jgi:hypothetical protein
MFKLEEQDQIVCFAMWISAKKHRRFMDVSSAMAQALLTPVTGDPPEPLQSTLPAQAGVQRKEIGSAIILHMIM